MSEWVKGKLPTKSGNYEVKYPDGTIGRDDFTVVGNHWWNVGDSRHPEQVEWKPDSYIPYTEDGSFNGKCIEDFEFIQAKTALELVEKGGIE